MPTQEKLINKPVFTVTAKAGDDCHWLPGDQCDRSATIPREVMLTFTSLNSGFPGTTVPPFLCALPIDCTIEPLVNIRITLRICIEQGNSLRNLN